MYRHGSLEISNLTNFAKPGLLRAWVGAASWPDLLLIAGVAAIALPTMLDVARDSWSTEQGAHGPIVLVTGIWLLVRELRLDLVRVSRGSRIVTLLTFVPLMALYCLARISGIIEIEAFAMYGALVAAAYCLWGGAVLKRIWFPLIYLMFVFPPPDTLFALVTQPLKILISRMAVDILQIFQYPIAQSGVVIQIGEYQMLVAAACAGLSSLISLTALGLFYTYIRHKSNFVYMIFLAISILPISIIANLVRVLALLLITYHLGEAAGQGFFHELAGLTMFATALICIFGLDWLATSIIALQARKVQAHG